MICSPVGGIAGASCPTANPLSAATSAPSLIACLFALMISSSPGLPLVNLAVMNASISSSEKPMRFATAPIVTMFAARALPVDFASSSARIPKYCPPSGRSNSSALYIATPFSERSWEWLS